MVKHRLPVLTCLFLALLMPLLTVGQGQKAPCQCPQTDYAESKPATSYSFRNGKTIVLCGFQEPDGRETLFSEFVLAVCGQKSIIGFWDAQRACHVKMKADTLLIEDLMSFPTGQRFAEERSVWTIEKLFFVNGQLNRKLQPNRALKKYDPATIRRVLMDYETARARNHDDQLDLARRLLIATFSGDAKARTYLKGFAKKYPFPGGEYAEGYSDLLAKLAIWDKP